MITLILSEILHVVGNHLLRSSESRVPRGLPQSDASLAVRTRQKRRGDLLTGDSSLYANANLLRPGYNSLIRDLQSSSYSCHEHVADRPLGSFYNPLRPNQFMFPGPGSETQSLEYCGESCLTGHRFFAVGVKSPIICIGHGRKPGL